MKKKSKIHILSIVLCLPIIIILVACEGNSGNKEESKWEGTRWERLMEENIKLRIPSQFKRSSRYNLNEDIPALAADSASLIYFQDQLEALEFTDSEIDVFIDTTKVFRIVIICNTEKIDFTQEDIGVMRYQLNAQIDELANSRSVMEYGEVSASFSETNMHKLALFNFKSKNTVDNSELYNSVYYLSGSSYSLVVYEYNSDEDMIQEYLWTTKLQDSE